MLLEKSKFCSEKSLLLLCSSVCYAHTYSSCSHVLHAKLTLGSKAFLLQCRHNKLVFVYPGSKFCRNFKFCPSPDDVTHASCNQLVRSA